MRLAVWRDGGIYPLERVLLSVEREGIRKATALDLQEGDHSVVTANGDGEPAGRVSRWQDLP
jgi:hypothetical protein